MNRYQTVLPGATRIECKERVLRERLKEAFRQALTNGYWWCNVCECICERIEGEQGEPAHCHRCGSHRIEFQKAILVSDTDLLDPEDLKV